jgi:hypothetical protein
MMKRKTSIVFSIILLAFFACTKEKKYQYEVNPVNVTQEASIKTNRKSTTEFISIAYADLFNTTIPQSKLVNLTLAYSSFGDLKVIEERIIQNFLNDSTANIPLQPSVNGDTLVFITNSYKKFYNRQPNEMEKHYWRELIRANSSVKPITIYYAIMTSDEYRFY